MASYSSLNKLRFFKWIRTFSQTYSCFVFFLFLAIFSVDLERCYAAVILVVDPSDFERNVIDTTIRACQYDSQETIERLFEMAPKPAGIFSCCYQNCLFSIQSTFIYFVFMKPLIFKYVCVYPCLSVIPKVVLKKVQPSGSASKGNVKVTSRAGVPIIIDYF